MKSTKNNFFKYLFKGGFLFFSPLFLWIQTPTVLYAEVVKVSVFMQAEEYSLKGEREKAIQILVSSLRSTPKNSKKYIALENALRKHSEIFYSEKGMKNFNLAQSLHRSDAKLAKLTLQEALVLEPANLKVENLLIELYLQGKNCSSALDLAKEVLTRNPFAYRSKVFQLYAYLCLEDYDLFASELSEFKARVKGRDKNRLKALLLLKKNDKKNIKEYLETGAFRSLSKNTQIILQWKALNQRNKIMKSVGEFIKYCESDQFVRIEEELFFLCDFASELKNEYSATKGQEVDKNE